MFELNDTQKKHAEAIRWLLSTDDADIGTGRSVLLAVAQLELAEKNPGQWIRVISHMGGLPAADKQVTFVYSVWKHKYDEKEWDIEVSAHDPEFRLIKVS